MHIAVASPPPPPTIPTTHHAYPASPPLPQFLSQRLPSHSPSTLPIQSAAPENRMYDTCGDRGPGPPRTPCMCAAGEGARCGTPVWTWRCRGRSRGRRDRAFGSEGLLEGGAMGYARWREMWGRRGTGIGAWSLWAYDEGVPQSQ